MFDLLKSIKDPSKVTPEQITQAYEILKEYATEHNTDVLSIVNNDANIKPAAEEIHSNLGWAVRKMISADKIEALITENLQFIREKALEQYNLENPPKKTKAKTKK